MAFFDSIIAETGEKFDLTDDQSKALLTALLGLMNDSKTGGFSGLRSRFNNANSGDAFSSSTTNGENAAIAKEQIESAFGAETIAAVADRAGLDYATTVSAMTFLLPRTIDRLTPNGAAPDERKLRSVISELSGESNKSAAAVENPANAVSTNAFDRIGNATEDVGVKNSDMMSDNRINEVGAVGDRFSAASAAVSDDDFAGNLNDEFNDDSPMKWIAPLIITVLLIVLGFWFCGENRRNRQTLPSVSTRPELYRSKYQKDFLLHDKFSILFFSARIAADISTKAIQTASANNKWTSCMTIGASVKSVIAPEAN